MKPSLFNCANIVTDKVQLKYIDFIYLIYYVFLELYYFIVYSLTVDGTATLSS